MILGFFVMLLSCGKEDGMDSEYPRTYSYQGLEYSERVIAHVENNGNFSVISQDQWPDHFYYFFSDTGMVFQSIRDSVLNEFAIIEVTLLSDTTMNLMAMSEGEFLDTIIDYKLNPGGLIVSGVDTLPFSIVNDEIEYCSSMELILADPNRVGASGIDFNTFKCGSEAPMDALSRLIKSNDLIENDTVGFAILQFLYD